MSALQRFNEFLVKVGSWGTILFMAVMAVVIPYEVIGRYVFQKMSIWSGEVSTFSLAWASMLGGAVGLKKGYSVNMSSVVDVVRPAVARVLKLVAYLFSLFFFGAMFYFGLSQTIMNSHQLSPAIELVMAIQDKYQVRIADQNVARNVLESVDSIAEFLVREKGL